MLQYVFAFCCAALYLERRSLTFLVVTEQALAVFDNFLAEIQQSKTVFTPHLASASVLFGKTGNLEIASFYSNALPVCYFAIKRTKAYQNYHLITVEPLLFSKWYVDSAYQRGLKKGASARLLHMHSVFTKFVIMSVVVSKMGVVEFFVQLFCPARIESHWMVLFDILLNREILATVKHVAVDNFVFQQDSTSLHRVTCSGPVATAQNSHLHSF